MAITCVAKKSGQDTPFPSTFQPSARGRFRKIIYRPTAMLAGVNSLHRKKFHGSEAKHELGVAICRNAARIESGGTPDCPVAIGGSGVWGLMRRSKTRAGPAQCERRLSEGVDRQFGEDFRRHGLWRRRAIVGRAVWDAEERTVGALFGCGECRAAPAAGGMAGMVANIVVAYVDGLPGSDQCGGARDYAGAGQCRRCCSEVREIIRI